MTDCNRIWPLRAAYLLLGLESPFKDRWSRGPFESWKPVFRVLSATGVPDSDDAQFGKMDPI